MDVQIGVALIIGLVFASTMVILNSRYFAAWQKIVLCFLIIFPPAQWVLGTLIWLYNKNFSKLDSVELDRAASTINNLIQFKEKGILSEIEFTEKFNTVIAKTQMNLLQTTEEYKDLLKLKTQNLLTDNEFESKVKSIKENINIEGDIQDRLSTKLNLEKRVLIDGRILTITNKIVSINNKLVESGFFRLKPEGTEAKIIEVVNNRFTNEYYHISKKNTPLGVLEVGVGMGRIIECSCPVWLNGKIAPNNVYEWGTDSKIEVENGRVKDAFIEK